MIAHTLGIIFRELLLHPKKKKENLNIMKNGTLFAHILFFFFEKKF